MPAEDPQAQFAPIWRVARKLYGRAVPLRIHRSMEVWVRGFRSRRQTNPTELEAMIEPAPKNRAPVPPPPPEHLPSPAPDGGVMDSTVRELVDDPTDILGLGLDGFVEAIATGDHDRDLELLLRNEQMGRARSSFVTALEERREVRTHLGVLDGTVKDLEAFLDDEASPPLQELFVAERRGKNRTTALKAIRRRM